MSVADDPRLLATTPRPVLPPPFTGAGHPLNTPIDAQRMQEMPVVRATRHTRHASAEWRDFYLATRRRVDIAAYSRMWGTSLAERFTSYMAIVQDTLVTIFAKPDDAGGMTVPTRCVNTAEELAEYDAELAQDPQRQTEAEATQAHVARMCLAELDVVLGHCDAARLDAATMLTRDSTIAMVQRALEAPGETHSGLWDAERPHNPPAADQHRDRRRTSPSRCMALVVLLGPPAEARVADGPLPRAACRRRRRPGQAGGRDYETVLRQSPGSARSAPRRRAVG